MIATVYMYMYVRQKPKRATETQNYILGATIKTLNSPESHSIPLYGFINILTNLPLPKYTALTSFHYFS